MSSLRIRHHAPRMNGPAGRSLRTSERMAGPHHRWWKISTTIKGRGTGRAPSGGHTAIVSQGAPSAHFIPLHGHKQGCPFSESRNAGEGFLFTVCVPVDDYRGKIAQGSANPAGRVMLEIERDGNQAMAKNAKTNCRKKAESDIEGAELAPMLNDFLENGELGAYLDHIGLGADGLPPDCDGGQLMATVKQFYVGDGELDMAVVAGDLASYPPIAARVRELRREKFQERQRKKRQPG